MINKIKDKQTGEYHDIGGLKCKLVAEGSYDNSLSNAYEAYYRLNNKLEDNKFYYIVRFDALCEEALTTTISTNTVIGDFVNVKSTMIVNNDNNGKHYIGGCFYRKEKNCLITGIFTETEDFIMSANENDFVEIYELPFALEV